ncbi:MAG: ABC transporter substrate-binding protein [Amphritea sp.]
MKKSILTIASAIAGLSMMSSTARADCGEVVITEMNWASSALITSVSKFIMQQGYGCTVQTVPSSTVPSITSVAETGKPDIVTELWLSTAGVAYSKLESQGKVVTAAKVISDGGQEGWWIPKYLADKYPELKTIDGILANPTLVGSVFHNSPVGWGSRNVNDNMKVAYGLEAHSIEVFDHGSGETLAASMASAYQNKEPWFGYYWAPTAVLGKYPMVKVDVGPYTPEVYSCNTTQECAKPGKSDYPAAKVVTAVTKDFSDREPEIFELMKNISLSSQQLSELLAWQDQNKASVDEAAVYFLTNYKDAWSGWLSDDARQKLSALLN